jgi:membrane protease YdiL (CAAX protease family)
MNEPTHSRPPTRATPFQATLQIIGFAGASHVLHHAIALFPLYQTSGLAESAPLFTDGDPQALGKALLMFALVPALLEELLFRGVLFAVFERLRGPGFAIAASALLFGLAHFDAHHTIVATLLGLQLGLLRHLFGLPLAICAHLLNNVLALSATYLSQTNAHDLPPFEAGAASLSFALATAGSAWAVLVHRLRSSRSRALASGTGLQTPGERDE